MSHGVAEKVGGVRKSKPGLAGGASDGKSATNLEGCPSLLCAPLWVGGRAGVATSGPSTSMPVQDSLEPPFHSGIATSNVQDEKRPSARGPT